MLTSLPPVPARLRQFGRRLKRLRRDNRGLALIEFAISLPIFLGLGMFGVELANYAVTSMNVSQISLTIADNAARMGQTSSSSTTKTIYRSDVNSIFAGAAKQGENIDLTEHGRVVLSSLETVGVLDKQLIRWQRCTGSAAYASRYGPELTSEVTDPSFTGMGPTGREIRAPVGDAVMYVEVFYEYQGLFGDMFLGNRVIRHEAAFPIRDDRDLLPGVADDGAPDPVCSPVPVPVPTPTPTPGPYRDHAAPGVCHTTHFDGYHCH
ncbi:TadE/TadG family type IV pilus assembly protein [Citromicrobium bathyomarinum]|uniref:TadE/TadG family type IV pilus assembly protein n=1 Tax=Citromicrobium bathyomarinum TaxID=72174 RepID=UPI001E4495D0|nr:TadE/TadG family type IV pilus assembly protein [Citromicrobium bathyomarinum]MCD1624044.1 pilus assembly protein [Citromicrobium bathyomarinum]